MGDTEVKQVGGQLGDETPAVALREHSNANLLKIDTNDKYSTVSAIKKFIVKELSGGGADIQTVLKGMQRMNKNPKTPYLFMAFDTPESRAAASTLLQTLSFRSTPWREIPVTQRDLSLTHKGGVKRPRAEQEGSKLTQYESYPIAEQLERKRKHCLAVMKIIVPSKVFGWSAYADRFTGIVESPVLEGYRNHVNLSFGFAEDGTATLGFQRGSLAEGSSSIESAVDPEKNIVTMHPAAKVVAAAMMDLCRELQSDERGALTVFDKITGTGFWRKLQVRHNVRGEVMLDVELDVDSVAPEVFAACVRRMVEVCSSDELKKKLVGVTGSEVAAVVSLQYHKHSGIHSISPEAPRVVLYGVATLTEYLSGLQFELSPTAFFQVNTLGMERMLDKVREVAHLSPRTVLLDLCSGTGTIGLTLARHVRKVIGIELVESAVANARRNAERNGVANTKFLCGRVEQLLPDVINGLSAEDRHDVVAILDPPRAGVSGTVLKWIRGTPAIRQVVYISCEQKALERDCPGLTKPSTKAYRGIPFEVTAAFAVDLFPHTHHVEMVAVLARAAHGESSAGRARTLATTAEATEAPVEHSGTEEAPAEV